MIRTHEHFVRRTLSAVVACIATTAVVHPAFAQPAVSASSHEMAPINDLPNPYRTIEGWAKMGGDRTWGSTSAVAIDRDGKTVWVAERCGTNSCAQSHADPIIRFGPNGQALMSFGKDMLLSPHALFVDHDGNLWAVDCACTGGTTPADSSRGHQVYKFDRSGKLLMTLGKKGGGRAADFFWQPNAVFVAPNGEIYVSEGHSSRAGANARVLKFSKDGKLITTWGTFGKGPTNMDQPHALAMDSKGRLFVADRGNDRIQIYDQQGTLLDTWYQFSRPSGLWIDKDDVLYVADSESGSVNPPHSAWTRGIRIGSARDGTVKYFIPDPTVGPPSTSSAEGIAVDAAGVIYGAEVGQKAVKRYEKK